MERELKEELGIEARIEEYIGSNTHDYGSTIINLHLFRTIPKSDNFTLSDHDKIAWVNILELSTYKLAPADIPFIDMLIEKFG